jgi:hypothetical protein
MGIMEVVIHVPDLNIPAFNLAKIEITEYTEKNLF